MASAMLALAPIFACSEVSGADASSAPRVASVAPTGESGAVMFSEPLSLAGQEPDDLDTGEPRPTNKDGDAADNSDITTGGEEPRETGEPTEEPTTETADGYTAAESICEQMILELRILATRYLDCVSTHSAQVASGCLGCQRQTILRLLNQFPVLEYTGDTRAIFVGPCVGRDAARRGDITAIADSDMCSVPSRPSQQLADFGIVHSQKYSVVLG